MARQGQSWSIDYAAGLLIFIVAIAITAGIVTNTVDDQSFKQISDEADNLVSALMSEGYPSDWDATDLVRAGVLSGGRFSERKMRILASMSYEDLLTVLPSAAKFYMKVSHADGSSYAFGDSCGLGHEEFELNETPHNTSRTLAYYQRSSGPNRLETYATTRNATIFRDDEIFTLLDQASKYEVIILENPALDDLVTLGLNGTQTETMLRQEFVDAAKYGSYFVITGMTGIPFLGINTTTNSSNLSTVYETDTYFATNETAIINVTLPHELIFLAPSESLLGNLDGSTHDHMLAADGSHTTVARWQYEDAIAYYFADTEGDYNDGTTISSFRTLIEEGVDRLMVRSSVQCSYDADALDTDNLMRVERVVAGKGEVLTMTLYTWN